MSWPQGAGKCQPTPQTLALMDEAAAKARNAVIEECAKEVERGYFLGDMIRCADTLDDCAARIRALALSRPDREGCGVMTDVEARISVLSDALKSIAKNTCCDNCQEAALVARSALSAQEVVTREKAPLPVGVEDTPHVRHRIQAALLSRPAPRGAGE